MTATGWRELVAVLVLLSGAGALSWQQGHAQDAAAAPVVLVSQAERRSIRPAFEHPAVIESLETASVRSLVAAQVIASHVHPGAIVRQGDLLFELDPRDYEFALSEAQASLRLEQANANQAKLEFERVDRLAGTEAVSQQQRDLSRAQYDVANAKVAMAQVQVERAQKDLDDTKIYAPFEGRISAANRAVGDYIVPGDPTQPEPMARIVRLDPIYALVYVSQQVYNEFLRRRERLQDAGEDIPTLEVTLTLPGGEVYPHVGKFVSWDFQAAASRGSIAGRAEFPNPEGKLLPGENVTISGRLVEAVDRVVIPQRAVAQDQEGRYVMVVGADGIVERRLVELGIRDGSDWTVIDGLEDGETVIVEGLQLVRPGIEVSTRPFDG